MASAYARVNKTGGGGGRRNTDFKLKGNALVWLFDFLSSQLSQETGSETIVPKQDDLQFPSEPVSMASGPIVAHEHLEKPRLGAAFLIFTVTRGY